MLSKDLREKLVIEAAKRLMEMTIPKEQLNVWFEHHPPKSGQIVKYNNIRAAAKYFALVVLENTPPSADQTDAIRKIREAVMTANASIACEGK